MNVRELHDELSVLYPRDLSCSWDNDGIMLSPDLNSEVKRILVALDATEATLEYALGGGYDVVLTHHPMIFKGLKSVTEINPVGRRVLKTALAGISVISLHTRLDAADGGVNDDLCSALGYAAVGKFGDDDNSELGRIIEIEEMTARDFALLVKEKLGCDAVRLNGEQNRIVKRIALCGGDGKSFVYPALAAGCDAFVTGDAGYNIAGDAAEEGLVTIEAGHYHTEAPVCRSLVELLRNKYGIEADIYDSCTYTVV